MSVLLNLPNISYCTEMLLAVLLFWVPLEKRSYPLLRFPAGIPLLVAESAFVGPWLQRQGVHVWFYVVFLTMLGVILFSSKTSLWEALYCLSCAYLTQHFASSGYLFLFQMGWMPSQGVLLQWLYPLLYLAVYVLFFLIFARGMTENRHYPVRAEFSVAVTVVTVAVVYFLSILSKNLTDFMKVDTDNLSYQVMLGICQIYAMFVCFLILSLLKFYRNELHAWKMLDRNKTIWNQRKLQYQFSKENMDLMNQKFHDMKHQLAAISQMEDSGGVKRKYIEELENIIRSSGSYAQTGNDALDTILTEKGLYCSTHGIRWTCVADGTFLSFIDVVDLYTMMGNALDNAVESVEKTESAEKRFISVNIRREKAFALIQIKNCMQGKLQYRENLPVTSKTDADNHGFGLRSIRNIVEKYRGTMTVSSEDEVFTLNILIPLE